MKPVRVVRSKHPRYEWEVIWYEGGRMLRRYFVRRDEADALRRQVEDVLGKVPAGTALASPEEMRGVIRARELGVSLLGAVEFFAASGRAGVAEVTVSEAVDARLEAMALEWAGRESQHFEEVSRALRSLAAFSGSRPLAAFSAEEARRWVYGTPARSRSALKKRRDWLKAFLEYARAPGRRWVLDNVAESVALPPVTASEEIAILTPEQARDYLKACAGVSEALLAFEAVLLFAGIRRAEAGRLGWEDVYLDRGFIEVGKRRAKTRTRRLVDIQPALRRVLEAATVRSGSLMPANYERLRDRAQKAAGWRGKKFFPPKPDPSAPEWPANVLRHSFVSYHLAAFEEPAKTALQAGHDEAMLFAHYREVVTREQAAEFWAIRVIPECG